MKNGDLQVAPSTLYKAVMLSLTRSVLRCLRVSAKVLGLPSPKLIHIGNSKRLFSSPERRDRLWSPPKFLLNRNLGVKLTTHSTGADVKIEPQLHLYCPRVPSRCGQGKFLPSSVLIRTVCHSAFCQSAYHFCDQEL